MTVEGRASEFTSKRGAFYNFRPGVQAENIGLRGENDEIKWTTQAQRTVADR